MTNKNQRSLGTPSQLNDPNYFPPLRFAIPLGIQHVMAMFVSNITPAIILAGAAGFGFGSNSADFPSMIYMIQMSMLFAGVATLLQTIGIGPVGARLPIVQGTSFAFIPVMLPLVAGKGVDAMGVIAGGVLVGGLCQAALAPFIPRLRFALPPLVIGVTIFMIGLALLKIGVQYAAGGVPKIGTPAFGAWQSWLLAATVIIVTMVFKFYMRGILSVSAVLIGLIAGYVLALLMGKVGFGNVEKAAFFALPKMFPFGVTFVLSAVVGITLMAFISAIETIGDVSGTTKGGANREATNAELRGATYADGLGTALSGVFGALPNTSFSQNVGLIALTRVMSRHIASCGAVFLVIGGLIPKFGAVIASVPIEVLGGGVIIMFGMVVSAGIKILSAVEWSSRNMFIFGVSLSLGVGLQQAPEALQHLPVILKYLLSTGLFPAVACAILLNLIIPHEEKTE